METTNIYILIDPETNLVRYVGKANNISERYKAHLNKARKHQIHKRNWINNLRKKGLKPIISIIDIVPVKDWIFWETYWISQFKTWGFNLVNYTEGGDGSTFGNQTSFKKGNKSWNTGSANTFICEICKIPFKASLTSKRKFCSHLCNGINKKNNQNKGNFKKGVIPWNITTTGYKTKKRIPILQLTLDGNFIKEFECCKEAAKEMNCHEENIRNVCLGNSKTAKGFKWKYK